MWLPPSPRPWPPTLASSAITTTTNRPDAQQPAIFNQFLAIKPNDPASIQWPLISVATVTWNRTGCKRAPFYAPNGDPPESDPCTDLSNRDRLHHRRVA